MAKSSYCLLEGWKVAGDAGEASALIATIGETTT
jgi:hypothetical protein